jgi:hypothetical protein
MQSTVHPYKNWRKVWQIKSLTLTGKKQWASKPTVGCDSVFITPTLAASNDQVFGGNYCRRGHVTCLDSSSGKLLWDFGVPEEHPNITSISAKDDLTCFSSKYFYILKDLTQIKNLDVANKNSVYDLIISHLKDDTLPSREFFEREKELFERAVLEDSKGDLLERLIYSSIKTYINQGKFDDLAEIAEHKLVKKLLQDTELGPYLKKT